MNIESGSVYSAEFQDYYFQQEFPIDEINHVFIRGTQLILYWDECEARQQDRCIIAETGFGSGLNFIVTWQHWSSWCESNPQSTLQLHFISAELLPLSTTDLNIVYQQFPDLMQLSSALIEQWPPSWQGCHARQFSQRVFLSLFFGDVLDMLQQHPFRADVWFLDGFAPSRNQKMWNVPLYQLVASHSKQGARIATYTAAGHVRRGLENAGFQINKQPGFCKRDMSAGFYKTHDRKPLKQQAHVLRLRHQKRFFAVIGAGYAGLHIAQALQEQGIEIDLYDQASGPVQGASNNHAHLTYLNPRSVQNEFNDFFEQAYSFSMASYQNKIGATPVEVMHVVQDKLAHWTQSTVQKCWPQQWLQFVNAQQASKIAGVPFNRPGLWMPHGFVIQPQKFAQQLLQQAKDIHTLFDHTVVQLVKNSEQGWLLVSQKRCGQSCEKQYDGVVIAAGSGTIALVNDLGNKCIGTMPEKLSHWRYPFRPIAGQSSVLPSSQQPFSQLNVALCGKTYVTPSIDGAISFGSSFYPDQFDTGVSDQSHLENVEGLIQLLNLDTVSAEMLPSIMTGFSGTRVQTTDYLPMVGSIFPEQGKHLYVMAGFGAKGSMVSPFAAALLTQLICGLPLVTNQKTLDLVDPARFSRRIERRYK